MLSEPSPPPSCVRSWFLIGRPRIRPKARTLALTSTCLCAPPRRGRSDRAETTHAPHPIENNKSLNKKKKIDKLEGEKRRREPRERQPGIRSECVQVAARCKRASVPRPTGFWRDLLESRATEPDTSDYSSLRLFKTSSGVLGSPEEERGKGGVG